MKVGSYGSPDFVASRSLTARAQRPWPMGKQSVGNHGYGRSEADGGGKRWGGQSPTRWPQEPGRRHARQMLKKLRNVGALHLHRRRHRHQNRGPQQHRAETTATSLHVTIVTKWDIAAETVQRRRQESLVTRIRERPCGTKKRPRGK